MISVKEAKQLISDHIEVLHPITVSLDIAAGHVLSKDIYALYDIPAFSQSSMDGYAFRFEDYGKVLYLVGEMAAGTSETLMIKNGEASRIFTGAPLPEGADTVIMQEKTTQSEGKVIPDDQKITIGANVRDKGSEISSGELAMKKGDFLNPAAIGFLASIGTTAVEVFPMPKVSIILTGNELQQPGTELEFGQVYESNSYSIFAALKAEGITDIELFWVSDDLERLTETLQSAMKISDVVLLTGGCSVGDYDYALEATDRCGIKEIFHKVKQKPGKPLFFGKKDKQLIFGLPGNPSSVLNCFYNYVLPALKSLSNKTNTVLEIPAKLSQSYTKHAGLTHFLKGRYLNGVASPLDAQESFRLSSFAQANCLICLSEEQEEFRAGETVRVLLLPQ